jgi:hypothetical protein
MPVKSVQAYRAEADRLREMAERAHTLIGRSALLEMTEQYDVLAAQAGAMEQANSSISGRVE